MTDQFPNQRSCQRLVIILNLSNIIFTHLHLAFVSVSTGIFPGIFRESKLDQMDKITYTEHMSDQLRSRLFAVLYFSERSSRSSALLYGLSSSMSVKTTQGVRGWLGGSEKLLVCYTAVFSVVTEERCVTTLKTAVYQAKKLPQSYNPRRPPPRYI